MASKEKAMEDAILAICKKHTDAVSDAVFAKELPNSNIEQRAVAINGLLASHKIQLFQTPGSGEIKYKAMLQQDSVRLKNLTAEDLLVYQVIQSAGNMGIWTRDMKTRTNLAQPRINKILKNLEDRVLVKSIKSVQNSNRKVYMLAELEPAKELTGGPWYGENQDVDTAFIEALRDVVKKFVVNGPARTMEEISEFISKSGVSNQVLQLEDVQRITKTLVYDKILEELYLRDDDGSIVNQYRENKFRHEEFNTHFGDIPCGRCPVMQDCYEGGKISPENCSYYSKWLEDF